MAGEARILDASVAAKCFIEEPGSEDARRRVLSQLDWIAPDLIFLEIASVMTKAVRRSAIELEAAERAVSALPTLVASDVAGRDLCDRAFALAVAHGFSAYDASYLALAEREQTRVLTADRKLVERAEAVGLGALVDLLENP
jgi:predicted nucleic acid-binding protein